MLTMDQKITCFGETLWDILPSGAMPGGAAMNVAIHFKYNGFSPFFISRIGNDSLGKDLLEVLKNKGISTQYIQLDKIHPTGVVKANISNKHAVTYEVAEAVAWDFIEYDEQIASIIAGSDFFIYGSLAARSTTSHNTILQYLKFARYKVFDVNLRPPHYSPKLIQQLMSHANIVKMNYHELIEVLSWFGKIAPEKQAMEYIKQRFNLDMLLISRGEKGAIVLNEKDFVEHAGFKVKVEDTIGSGDAFLAAFISQLIKQVAPQQALEFASATGACVATRSGGLPQFSEKEIYNFIRTYSMHPDAEQ
jgi:fructokinase